MKGRVPTDLWSETLQTPGSPESQRVNVSRGRKQGMDPDPEGIQHQGRKVSERDEDGQIWRRVMHFTGRYLGPFLSIRGPEWVLWGIWRSDAKVPGEETRPVCSETGVSEKGARELRSSLKLSASLCPAEKRPKAEPLAATFSGCRGGSGGCNSFGSLEEKDSIQVELQGSELWKRFHDIGTEMIITKAGRFGFAQAVQGPHTVGT